MRIFWTRFLGKARFIASGFRRDRSDVVRLSDESLNRIASGHTPVAEWPEVDETIFAPGTFEKGGQQAEDHPAADAHSHA